jgi:hypothetical protein
LFCYNLDSFYIGLTQYTANTICWPLLLALLVFVMEIVAILSNRQESIVMLLFMFWYSIPFWKALLLLAIFLHSANETIFFLRSVVELTYCRAYIYILILKTFRRIIYHNSTIDKKYPTN